MNLLIVESPNKCPKIQALLDGLYGKLTWTVASTVGHIRDLPAKELGVDRANKYKPTYLVSDDKRPVVARLKKLVEQVGKPNVYIATDPDREGEAIGYHVCVCLGLPVATTHRVMFHEITPKAIKTALDGRGTLNTQLVLAQEARRVIDRLAGYEVSSILSRKQGEPLSAGRVQSVALRLSVERERQIEGHKDSFSVKLKGHFITPAGDTLVAAYHRAMTTQPEAQAYLTTAGDKRWRVSEVSVKPVVKPPKGAYTTSTLQQDAIRRLGGAQGGWTAKRVMDVAQKLFEQGAITYMRTDSPNLSADAVAEIRQTVTADYGANYFKARTFSARESAQEAHEAIRPTHFSDKGCGETADEKKLYLLIYCRAMASQMAAAVLEQTIVTIQSQQEQDVFMAKASVEKFNGYRVVYQEMPEEETAEEEPVIKSIATGNALRLATLTARQTFAQPAKRFDEASLVAELEKRGIGRPSTYASILSAITIRRPYLVSMSMPARNVTAWLLTWQNGQITPSTQSQSIGGDKHKLVPSPTGVRVTGFLEMHFKKLVDYAFTADMEANLDAIVDRKSTYAGVVGRFDEDHQAMLRLTETAVADVPRKNAPVAVGTLDGLPVVAGISLKTGKTYIRYNEQLYSTEKKPGALSIDDVREVMADKVRREADRVQNTLRSFSGKGKTYTLRTGEYGVYLTDGKRSAPCKNLTTQAQIDSMTPELAEKLLVDYAAAKKAGASGGGGKKAVRKK